MRVDREERRCVGIPAGTVPEKRQQREMEPAVGTGRSRRRRSDLEGEDTGMRKEAEWCRGQVPRA